MTLGTRIVVMKDGVVQQVDTPQTLYNAPANLFVAGFIGSPQMNFLDATVKVKGDEVYLQIGNTVLQVPASKKKSSYRWWIRWKNSCYGYSSGTCIR